MLCRYRVLSVDSGRHGALLLLWGAPLKKAPVAASCVSSSGSSHGFSRTQIRKHVVVVSSTSQPAASPVPSPSKWSSASISLWQLEISSYLSSTLEGIFLKHSVNMASQRLLCIQGATAMSFPRSILQLGMEWGREGVSSLGALSSPLVVAMPQICYFYILYRRLLLINESIISTSLLKLVILYIKCLIFKWLCAFCLLIGPWLIHPKRGCLSNQDRQWHRYALGQQL